MTEKEKLESLIVEGYKPHMVIVDCTYDDAPDDLPEQWKGREIHFLPLHHPTKDNIKFYFVNESTHRYAKSLVEDAKTIIGYHLCIYCGAVGEKTVTGKVHLDKIVDSLKKQKGWDVRESKYPDVFEVHFEIEGDNRELLNRYVNEVEEVAMLLSVKNDLGFNIIHYSKGPKYKAQPFSLTTGLFETTLQGVDSNDLKQFSKILKNEECLFAVNGLRDLNSQISQKSKLTLGWALLEDLFDTDSESIFDKAEKKRFKKFISDFELEKSIVLEKSITERIYKAVCSSPHLKIKYKNMRIAENVSSLLGEKYELVYEKVKAFANVRGGHAHSHHI